MSRTLFTILGFLFITIALGHSGHDHDHDHDHDETPEDSDVVVLGDDDFDDTVNNNQFVFAEFYAPWCGHCKRLAPDYEKVATHFKSINSPVIIAKIDATIHNEVASNNGVRGYPTLKFYKNGKAVDYDGGRTAEELIKWISKKTGPAAVEITSVEKLGDFTSGPGLKVVAFVSKDKAETILNVAAFDTMDDFQFAYVTDKALFGDRAENSVVIIKPGEPELVYKNEIVDQELADWIFEEGYPLYEELAQRIWQRSSTSQTPLLAVFAEEKNEASDALILSIAQKVKGKVLSSVSYAPQIAERWGSSGKVLPTGIVVNWKDNQPKLVIFDEESGPFDETSGVAFVEAALKGEYKGYKKSQPIPENNDGPVVVIVGKNFEEVVFDQSKDVFVEFYAPWCGHCKNLAPIWEELGKAFESVPSVVIANIDATANSYPETLEVQGFPTLIFFPADDKTGIPYSGDRDLDSLKEFVKKNASRDIPKEEL